MVGGRGMSEGEKHRVLVLDDDTLIRELFVVALEMDGRCQAVPVASYREAEHRCREEDFSLVFLDYHLPEGIGWNLAQTALAAREGKHAPQVVLMSGTVDESDVCVSERFSAQAILFPKPFSVNELFALLDRLLPTRAE